MEHWGLAASKSAFSRVDEKQNYIPDDSDGP